MLPKQNNLEVSRGIAVDLLQGLDARVQAERCGAVLHLEQGTGGLDRMEMRFMGEDIEIRIPEWEAHRARDGSRLDAREEILVLHYLGSTGAPPPDGDPITFGEVPSGEFYMAAFRRRAVGPLLAAFGQSPDGLLAASAPLGGTATAGGDAAVLVPALPRIDVTVVVWKGDDEFPPDATLLLSRGIASYLTTEDVAVLCGTIAVRLMKESWKKG